MKYTHMLIPYVVGVIIALGIMLGVSWSVGGPARFKIAGVFAFGFLAGMLSMYIKWRLMTK